MVIWRGWGWLVLILIIALLGWGWQLFPAIWGAITGYGSAYAGEVGVGFGIGWILIAIVLFLFNTFLLLKLERIPASGEAMQARIQAKRAAEARGEEFVVPQHTKPYSSFFFIPLRVLPLVFVGIGILTLALNIPAAIENQQEHRQFQEYLEQ